MAFTVVFVFDTVLTAAFAFVTALVNELVFVNTATFDAELMLMFAFVSIATLAFASTLTLASGVTVDSDGVSPTVSKTEIFPVSAGIAKSKADNIKTVAAAIVIFDKIVCEPRG